MARSVLRELATVLTVEADNFNNGIKAAQKEAREFEKTIKPSKDLLQGMGTAFTAAGGAITAAMLGAVKITADYGAELNKLSIQTGASTEQLSELKFAAEQSETSFEGVANGLKFLARNAAEAAEGSKAQVEAFRDIGVSVRDSTGALRPMNDLLLDVADRFAVMEDGTAKAALAQEIFGKSGMDLIPILNEGRAGIMAMGDEAERLGLVMSQEAAAAADQFDDTLTQVKAAATGLSVSIGQALLPGLTSAAETMRDGIAVVTDFAKEHEGLTQAIAGTAAALTGAGGLALGLAAVVTVAPKIAVGLQAISTGAKLVVADLGAARTATLLLTEAGAVKSYADLSAGISLLGESSKLAKVGLVGLAGAVGVAVGELINFGVEAAGYQDEMDGFIRKTVDATAAVLGFRSTQAQSDEMMAETTQAAADFLKNTYGVVIDQLGLSIQEWNRQVFESINAQNALNPTLQANITQLQSQAAAQRESARITQETGEALGNFWKKAAEAHEAFLAKQRAANDAMDAALKPADALEKALGLLTLRFDEEQIVLVHAAAIVKDVEAQRELGGVVSDTMERLYGQAQALLTDRDAAAALKNETSQLAEEQKRLVADFNAALKPADDLQKTLDKLNKEFSKENIIKIHRDRIIEVVEKQKELGNAVSQTMQAYYDMAKAASGAADAAVKAATPPIPEVQLPSIPVSAGRTARELNDELHAQMLAGIGGLAPQPAIPANFNLGGGGATSGLSPAGWQNLFRDWYPGFAPINLANTTPDLGIGMTAAQVAAMGPRTGGGTGRFGMAAGAVSVPVQLNNTNNISIQAIKGMSEEDIAKAMVRQLETNNRGVLDKTASMVLSAGKGLVSGKPAFAAG